MARHIFFRKLSQILLEHISIGISNYCDNLFNVVHEQFLSVKSYLLKIRF